MVAIKLTGDTSWDDEEEEEAKDEMGVGVAQGVTGLGHKSRPLRANSSAASFPNSP